MTTAYRNHTAISQSDLLIAKCLLTGTEKNIPVKAAMIGKAIHERVLEPELFDLGNYPVLACDKQLYATFEKCTNSLLSDERFQNLLSTGQKEETKFWQEPTTGTECKARIDILTPDLVSDLKTTSEYKQETFEASLSSYDYDLQLAFYMDSVALQNALIVGISKRNGKIFYVQIDGNSAFIKEGRRKYLFLLNKIVKSNLFERIYQEREKAREKEQHELQLLLEKVSATQA